MFGVPRTTHKDRQYIYIKCQYIPYTDYISFLSLLTSLLKLQMVTLQLKM